MLSERGLVFTPYKTLVAEFRTCFYWEKVGEDFALTFFSYVPHMTRANIPGVRRAFSIICTQQTPV